MSADASTPGMAQSGNIQAPAQPGLDPEVSAAHMHLLDPQAMCCSTHGPEQGCCYCCSMQTQCIWSQAYTTTCQMVSQHAFAKPSDPEADPARSGIPSIRAVPRDEERAWVIVMTAFASAIAAS